MNKLTLATLQVGQGALEVLNENFQLIQTAFDNTLSRDGTSPNQMASDFDMNSFRIYNLPNASTNSEPVTLGQLISMSTLVLYTPDNHVHDWNTQIANKPATYAPSAHTHVTSEITGLDASLAALDSRLDAIEAEVTVYVQATAPTSPPLNALWFW